MGDTRQTTGTGRDGGAHALERDHPDGRAPAVRRRRATRDGGDERAVSPLRRQPEVRGQVARTLRGRGRTRLPRALAPAAYLPARDRARRGGRALRAAAPPLDVGPEEAARTPRPAPPR